MGRGTNIFVLDTGLDASHIEFQGMDREVENVADFTTSPRWGNKAAAARRQGVILATHHSLMQRGATSM